LNQKPIFLTNYALVRILKELLLELGISDSKADVLAQVHAQQTSIPTRWSDFIRSNCAACTLSPDSCTYLNPTEEQCTGSTTPYELRGAIALMIESGKTQRCPVYLPKESA
jgi:hypothetical protein